MIDCSSKINGMRRRATFYCRVQVGRWRRLGENDLQPRSVIPDLARGLLAFRTCCISMRGVTPLPFDIWISSVVLLLIDS